MKDCYKDFSDEIIVTGKNWPVEFSWDHIGKTFNEGFEKSKGDWSIRMDLDYFFHEKYMSKLKPKLEKYSNHPAVAFPQYQIFTPDRYQIKTKLCIAINKKKFPDERPMVLDLLLKAQEEKIYDLSFRYGCRARNCGVCTIDINDRPKLACRARVREGDVLSAIATLPVIKDLVVKRDGITRQMKGYNLSLIHI